jgi:RNaseH domain of pPIWI_RE
VYSIGIPRFLLPQYIAAQSSDWEHVQAAKDLSYLAGFEDTQAGSDFFYYLSIGQMPKTARRQKRGIYKLDEGGGVAFKHQSIVEFVPFFLQQTDDPLTWCRVPHFLRFSPAWDGGNVLLPYPLHLARAVLEDHLCLPGETTDNDD